MEHERKFVKIPANTTHYTYLHGDWNRNGIPNVDDRRPFDPNSHKWVSKDLIFSDTIKRVERIRQSARDKANPFVSQFRSSFPSDSMHTHFRVKSTWSILDKLFRKQLQNNPYLSNDIVGVRAVGLNKKEAMNQWNRWSDKKHVPLHKREDKYKTNSKDAYRAFHSNMQYHGVPIEAQFMSSGFERLNNLQHEAYKRHEKQKLLQYRKDARILMRQGQ